MSHAAHFLTRLERLKAPEVELALALYRDPRIVKELISSLALENNSDRVALAMTPCSDITRPTNSLASPAE